MAKTHDIHEQHSHTHGPGCGHTAVEHEGHTDYLHDGHLHHAHEGHVCEHAFAVDAENPEQPTPEHDCGGHPSDHRHRPGYGHEVVPHGNHKDYLVNDHLHHVEGGRCHSHGSIKRAA